jgi:hypothetical protein
LSALLASTQPGGSGVSTAPAPWQVGHVAPCAAASWSANAVDFGDRKCAEDERSEGDGSKTGDDPLVPSTERNAIRLRFAGRVAAEALSGAAAECHDDENARLSFDGAGTAADDAALHDPQPASPGRGGALPASASRSPARNEYAEGETARGGGGSGRLTDTFLICIELPRLTGAFPDRRSRLSRWAAAERGDRSSGDDACRKKGVVGELLRRASAGTGGDARAPLAPSAPLRSGATIGGGW